MQEFFYINKSVGVYAAKNLKIYHFEWTIILDIGPVIFANSQQVSKKTSAVRNLTFQRFHIFSLQKFRLTIWNPDLDL